MKKTSSLKAVLTSFLVISSIAATGAAFANEKETEESNFCFKGDCDKNPLTEMHREIDNMMQLFFASPYLADDFSRSLPFKRAQKFPHSKNIFSSATYPRVDVSEKDNLINVSIEIPGIDKDKISAEVFDKYISLKYEEKSAHEEKDDETNYYLSERKYGSFERIIPLPEGAVIDKAEAEHKNGVLTITIPKKEVAKPKSKKLEI